MHGLAVYVKEVLPFARDLSLENSADSYLCFRLALLRSVSYFFFFYRSASSSLCTVFDSVSGSIDEVLSINPSSNVFAFGDFNVHHKDWLTYSGGTDRPGELCYNFSISNFSISSNIDEVLSINPSANVFVFGDFDVHHKDWLTYSGGADRPGELCYNFSISNGLTQIVNFPTQIPDL